ncbi:MAG TPA: ATP-binding protein [Candidatus Acidoferrum sp.]|jgi:signal transduction histidine kinase
MVVHNASIPGNKPWRARIAPLILPLSGLLIIAAIGVFAYVTQTGVENSRTWVLHTYDVRNDLQALDTELAQLRGNALAYAASGDKSQLQDFRSHAANVGVLTGKIHNATADNPRQQFRLGELESLFHKYLADLEHTAISAPQATINSEEAASIRALDVQESQLDAVSQSMAADERSLLENRLLTWNQFFKRNVIILAAIFTAALILLAYNFHLLKREVDRTHDMERLQRESAQSLRALSARVLELQDGERRKVARELHDSVGQYLVGLKISVEQLQNNRANFAAEDDRLLNEMVELTERSISEVRTISHLLHPPLLDEVGLESATRWYAEGFGKRCGLDVKLQLAEIHNRLPKQVELALFRVLQESLTNVHRHAGAKAIEIVLNCDHRRVTLTVHDDGRGIPREVVNRFRSGLASGVGLAGMRERLAELNGALEVESRPGSSTVRASIPIMESDVAQNKPLETTTAS